MADPTAAARSPTQAWTSLRPLNGGRRRGVQAKAPSSTRASGLQTSVSERAETATHAWTSLRRPNARLRPVSETSPNADIQRVLDAAARKGVTLDVTVSEQSTHTAEEAAAAVGAELGQIVKSLVFVAPGEGSDLELIICLVSGPNRVDLARLAAVTGERDVRRATAREANELTGFVIGGIPPIGHARPARVIMDPDLGRFQTVWAAAGSATAVFPVPPATLRTLANATVAPITEERRTADIEAERESAAGMGGLVGGGRTPAPNAGA
jgi:prolyl-tRNA editing enzyme YbaK/EbsC (Cys-tRNA(Pro) deacylase)